MDQQQNFNGAPQGYDADNDPQYGGYTPEQDYSPSGHGEPQQQQPQETPEQQRIRELEQQNAMFQQTFQQVQSWAEQQEAQSILQSREQARAERMKQIYEAAEAKPISEAWDYIQQENAKLLKEEEEYGRQQLEATRRAFAAPLFINHLMQTYELPDEARQTLNSVDPDTAARLAPQLKAQYDGLTQMQNQINQLSRATQARELQASGVGMVGGSRPSFGQGSQQGLDPDQVAMNIYRQLTGRG